MDTSKNVPKLDIKSKKLKDAIYEWRKQHFKKHPRTKTYREKEIERIQRTNKMLRKLETARV